MASRRSDVLRAEIEADADRLGELVNDESPSIRSLALGSLHRLGLATHDIVALALADDDRDVRCRALELAHSSPNIDIDHLLSDPDDLVVETCCWALGERPDATPAVRSRLAEIATSHDVPICREAAIAALGAIGEEDGLDAILHGMTDKPAVRRRAVLALAPFDGPEVTAALEQALTDRDRQVRQAAEDLL